jgi:GT2 family glycosyltransferase
VYVRSESRGASAARNEGVRQAKGDLLLFTDDDCTVDRDWVQRWCRAFEEEPALGIAFGSVRCPPFDPAHGHTPTFDPGAGSHSHGSELFQRGAGEVGLSANMALRRQVWGGVGGLDEGLGAGSRFPGAEEVDLAYRTVRAGHRLGHIGSPSVVHYGYRPGRSASRLAQGYATGTAAMYVKHVRCGDWFAARLLLTEAWLLLYRVLRGGMTGRRPLGLRSLVAYLKGLATALGSPVDPRRRLYRTEKRGGVA